MNTTTRTKSPATATINVGDGMTHCLPQDSYPYVVTRVSESGKTAWVKPLKIVDLTTGHEPARFDGPFPVWDHIYTDDERESLVIADAPERAVRLNKHGGWGSKGLAFDAGGARYHRNYSY